MKKTDQERKALKWHFIHIHEGSENSSDNDSGHTTFGK